MLVGERERERDFVFEGVRGVRERVRESERNRE